MGATKAVTQKGKFYFLPYWFKESGTYDLEVVPFEQLPEEIKQELLKQRNNENNGQQNTGEAAAGGTGLIDTDSTIEASDRESDSSRAES